MTPRKPQTPRSPLRGRLTLLALLLFLALALPAGASAAAPSVSAASATASAGQVTAKTDAGTRPIHQQVQGTVRDTTRGARSSVAQASAPVAPRVAATVDSARRATGVAAPRPTAPRATPGRATAASEKRYRAPAIRAPARRREATARSRLRGEREATDSAPRPQLAAILSVARHVAVTESVAPATPPIDGAPNDTPAGGSAGPAPAGAAPLAALAAAMILFLAAFRGRRSSLPPPSWRSAVLVLQVERPG